MKRYFALYFVWDFVKCLREDFADFVKCLVNYFASYFVEYFLWSLVLIYFDLGVFGLC